MVRQNNNEGLGFKYSMAEREGFEPPMELPPCRISSAVLSTTQPPLRVGDRLDDPEIYCRDTLKV
jgi:hypothetical protein